MSRIEELGEQLKSQLTQIWDKIKDTESYNQLRDKYESLTPTGQKISQIVFFGLLVGILIYVPFSQVQVSSAQIEQFETQRGLIRDLFKTFRESSGHLQMATPPTGAQLVLTIQTSLQNARLLPEQIVGVTNAQAEGNLIPQSLLADVVEVRLAKLNLRQIVDIGTQLTNLSPALKIKDLLINANPEIAGYFDVNYKIYALKIPEALPELPPEPINQKKKNSNSEDSSDL